MVPPLLLRLLILFGCSQLMTAQDIKLPVSLTEDYPSMPPQRPLELRVGFDIFNTRFDWNTLELKLFAQIVLVWNDPRRTFKPEHVDGRNTIVFEHDDNGLMHGFLSNLWMPPLKGMLEQASFRGSQKSFTERVTVSSSGMINMEIVHQMTFPCHQTSNFFPFDRYKCYMVLTNSVGNDTIKMRPPRVRSEYAILMPMFYSHGHRIVNISEKYKWYRMGFYGRDNPYKGQTVLPDLVEIAVEIERHSARAFPEIVIPVLSVAICDFFLFIFATSPVFSLSLLPLYIIHFEDMTFTGVVTKKPPLAIIFYGRLYSTVFCQCLRLLSFLLANSATAKSTDETACSTPIISYLRAMLISPSRRALLLSFSTAVCCLLLSINSFGPTAVFREFPADSDDWTWW